MESGQLLPVLAAEYKCGVKMRHPFPSFSTLLHLTVYVTLSALDFHLDEKGARSATQPGGTWTVGLGGV